MKYLAKNLIQIQTTQLRKPTKRKLKNYIHLIYIFFHIIAS